MFRKPRKPIPMIMKKLVDRASQEIATEPVLDLVVDDFNDNLNWIKARLSQSTDLVIREFTMGEKRPRTAALVYIDGLSDKKQLEDHVLRPLMINGQIVDSLQECSGNLYELMRTRLISVGDTQLIQKLNLEQIVAEVLNGSTALFVKGEATALLLLTPGWQKRGIEQPESEITIRGPREGFVETLRDNTAMLRRKLGSSDLTFETIEIGEVTKIGVTIAYLKNIANLKIVEEIKLRLKRIKVDGILAAGFIEEYIEDAPLSPFDTIGYTERPDVLAAKMLEGRVGIFTEGTPVVLTVPHLIVEGFQSPDDYNFRPIFGSLIRLVRFASFGMTILSPAIYVALTTFHQELLPTPLLISMVGAAEGTPFPSLIEVVVMGMIFEVLREAGIRLPRPVGQAVSIVGALVIGEATVSAGFVAAPTVIVIAITAITSFVNPKLSQLAIVLRFGYTIFAGFMGAFGIIIALLISLIHLASLRSFGVPYLAPLAPLTLADLKDVFIRAPLWMMQKRPRTIGWKNPVRQAQNQMPHPPHPPSDSEEPK